MTAKLRYLVFILLSLCSLFCLAETNPLPVINPWQQWTFSGVADDEEGNAYYYYFNYQQRGMHRLVDVYVLSNQLKPLIHYQKFSEKPLKRPQKPNVWYLGRTFFRFNPITQSWVFGIKTKGDIGFDFKVDVRPKNGDMGERQLISDGLSVEMNQFQQLNGHLFFSSNKEDKFVSAKRGWLRYIEGNQTPDKLMTLLCNQEDGAGLYSLQYQSSQANKAAIVGWRNAKGGRENVSQFIKLMSQPDNQWKLIIASPKTNWILQLLTKIENNPFQTLVMANNNENKSKICFYQTKR